MTPREAFDRMMLAAPARDVDAFADLMAEDGVLEFPFTPPGAPRRLCGREEIRAYLRAALPHAPDFREYGPITVHETTNPEVIIAEYEWYGRVASTGQSFAQSVVLVLQVRDGEIVAARDYLNPLALTDVRSE